MVDVLWTFIGFLVGVVAAGIAVEFGLKKFWAPPENSKLTTVWSLNELPAPLIAATHLASVSVPKNARLLTAGAYEGPRAGFDLRTNAELRGNFAVDASASRALIFLGPVQPGTLALWTVEEKLIERLRTEFNRLWGRSTDYVEKVSLADVPKKANLSVLTEGTVQDIVPYRGNYLLRLSDAGETVGVLVERDLPLAGRRVSVTGVVRTSSSGYPLIEALDVRQAI
jgi:hypothetical protein